MTKREKGQGQLEEALQRRRSAIHGQGSYNEEEGDVLIPIRDFLAGTGQIIHVYRLWSSQDLRSIRQNAENMRKPKKVLQTASCRNMLPWSNVYRYEYTARTLDTRGIIRRIEKENGLASDIRGCAGLHKKNVVRDRGRGSTKDRDWVEIHQWKQKAGEDPTEFLE